jgi:3-hydroxyacyl-CoA dehydrogenase
MAYPAIKKIAVLGAGTMGPGLAMSYAKHGYEVNIWSKDLELFTSAAAVIKTSLNTLADFDMVAREAIPDIIGRIKFIDNLPAAVEGAQYIVEAIVENRDAKRQLYAELDKLCGMDVIIASNTSILDIYELMVERRLPNTIIAHWIAPPYVIPLVEVVKGEKTDKKVVDITLDLLRGIEKIPVVLEKYVPGFIINRLQMILGKEVFYLLDDGYVTPEQLDLAVKASLAPRMMLLGLVQRYDFTGLDLSVKNIENGAYTLPPDNPRPRSLFEKVARGDLGAKTGRGFYDYGGRPLQDIVRERDVNLLKVFTQTKFVLDNHNK